MSFKSDGNFGPLLVFEPQPQNMLDVYTDNTNFVRIRAQHCPGSMSNFRKDWNFCKYLIKGQVSEVRQIIYRLVVVTIHAGNITCSGIITSGGNNTCPAITYSSSGNAFYVSGGGNSIFTIV